MLIKRLRGWEIPEREVTQETLVLRRRDALGTAAALSVAALAGALPGVARADTATVARNPKYTVDRALTAEKDATTYNNY